MLAALSIPHLAALALAAVAPTPRPAIVVTVDSAAHVVRIAAGRFMVAAASGHQDSGHGHGEGVPLMRFRWPVDGWLRGVHLTVTDGSGRVLPRRLAHHINVVNFDRRQLLYPAPERIFALGQETEDIELPKSVGVPVTAGSEMALVLVWHNPDPVMYHDVTVTLSVDWSPSNFFPRPVDVIPVYMNATNPIAAPADFDLPPGRNEFKADFTMPLDGRVIGVGGHLHDYGTGVTLSELRDGAERVKVRLGVERDAAGHMIKVERRLPGIAGRGIKVQAGREYRMTGGYDNPTGGTINRGAMVHLILILAPDDIEAWPRLDPEDEEFRRDVAWLEGESP
jgi:hypothetical protein